MKGSTEIVVIVIAVLAYLSDGPVVAAGFLLVVIGGSMLYRGRRR